MKRLLSSTVMQRLWHIIVWLSRIGHCRGFGIQSPSDYWLVRYVINEHWPYYKYSEIGQGDDWLTRKVGRLCFRLANWRQPRVVVSSAYQDYLRAGCLTAEVITDIQQAAHADLVRWPLSDDWERCFDRLCGIADEQTVLVADNLRDNRKAWKRLVGDERTGITFDLYYCGIVLFDKKRVKKNYIINF